MARKNTHSLMSSPRTVADKAADKAMDTWNELASTVETAVGRTQSAAHDAQDSLRDTQKNAKASVRKIRKNARKTAQESLKDARASVKSAQTSVKKARKETGRRTSAARDALAGRKPRRRWTLLVGIVGVGIGAAAGALGARLSRRDDGFDQLDTKLSKTDAPLADTKTAADGVPATSSVVADVPPVVATAPVPTAVPTTGQPTVSSPTVSSQPIPTQTGRQVMTPADTTASTVGAGRSSKPAPKPSAGKPYDGTSGVNGSSAS